jgi:hypothetical protein
MKKRFILLIDFSEGSAGLIQYASEWSLQTGAELVLFHQVSVMAPASADPDSRSRIASLACEEALQRLRALGTRLLPTGIRATYEVSERGLKTALSALLAAPFEHLIFLGLKETGLIKKIALGTTTLRVIDHLAHIVAAIPADIRSFSHHQLHVAVSDRHPLNILELHHFLRFIDPHQTNITFFHLAKPSENLEGMEKQLRDLCALFAGKYRTDFVIYEGHHPAEDIRKVIRNATKELLIVQKGSRLLTDQLFRKFLVTDLVLGGQTPLIILP